MFYILGAIALADYISVNPFIQKLDIRGNDIRLDGLKGLSEAMMKNSNIISLKVDPTSMDLVSKINIKLQIKYALLLLIYLKFMTSLHLSFLFYYTRVPIIQTSWGRPLFG